MPQACGHDGYASYCADTDMSRMGGNIHNAQGHISVQMDTDRWVGGQREREREREVRARETGKRNKGKREREHVRARVRVRERKPTSES